MISSRISLLSVLLSIVAILNVSQAAALETVDTELQRDTQLYVTGYQRDASGKGLLFLQLYNNYETPIDVSNWRFYIDSVDDNHMITFEAAKPHGYIHPKGHVVITSDTYVTGASLINMKVPSFLDERNASVIVVPPSVNNERNAIYTVRYTGDSTTKTTDDNLSDEQIWLRSQSTTAVYNSSFIPVSTSTIMDNGLYYIPEEPKMKIVEVYAYGSDCAPTDKSILCGDYIKLRIEGASQDTSHYVVRTSNSSTSRSVTNTFYLADYAPRDGYVTISLNQEGDAVSLTNSGGYMWIEDLYGLKRYDKTMTAYESFTSNEQGYSWAYDDVGSWRWTTTPAPYGANVVTAPVEEVTVCPAGKYLNPDTGRCRTLEEAVNALAACPEGQERNLTTNRCRSKVTTTSTSLTPCGEGQERNPATNRCRSIASAVAELMPCDEGYERNPVTNRCRKVAGASTGAPSAEQLVESAKGNGWNVWTWSLVAVAAGGAIGYGVYEWRHEIRGLASSIVTKLGKK